MKNPDFSTSVSATVGYWTSAWRRYQEKSRYLGRGYVFCCLLERVTYRFLRRIYPFDPWHCEGTWHCRPYKHVAVRMANNIDAETVVEVGCGLGDIISRVKARQRVGYDQDEMVVRAARRIRGSKVSFEVGSLSEVQEKKIDLLILVNWIHEVSPEALERMLDPVLDRTNFLLLDRILPQAQGYRFHHDFRFLERRFALRECELGGCGEPRELLLYEAYH